MDKERLSRLFNDINQKQNELIDVMLILRDKWNEVNDILPEYEDKKYLFDYEYDSIIAQVKEWKDTSNFEFAQILCRKEWKEKTVIMCGTSTCDDWYSVILKEMCTVCRYGEKALFRFASKLREQFASIKWNDGEEHTLYITANEVNIQYQQNEFRENIGRYDCSSDIYDEKERYYKLTMVPNGDAKFVEYVKEV